MPVVIGDWHIYQGLFNEFGDLPDGDVQRNEVPMKAHTHKYAVCILCVCVLAKVSCAVWMCVWILWVIYIYMYASQTAMCQSL